MADDLSKIMEELEGGGSSSEKNTPANEPVPKKEKTEPVVEESVPEKPTPFSPVTTPVVKRSFDAVSAGSPGNYSLSMSDDGITAESSDGSRVWKIAVASGQIEVKYFESGTLVGYFSIPKVPSAECRLSFGKSEILVTDEEMGIKKRVPG